MNEWMNAWMNEWMNERMNEWITLCPEGVSVIIFTFVSVLIILNIRICISVR